MREPITLSCIIILEVSHVSKHKTSITLRVPLCWRQKSAIRTAAKIQKFRIPWLKPSKFYCFSYGIEV